MKIFLAILALLCITMMRAGKPQVIGVLTVPNKAQGKNIGYVDEVYYNFLRQGGLQVLAIPYWKPRSFLKKMFKKTNGLYFQGGVTTYFKRSVKNNPQYRIFNQAIYYLIDLTVKANQLGNYYPIFGTCMGMHHISMYFARSTKILSRVNHNDQTAKINPTEHFESSMIYSTQPEKILQFLTGSSKALYFNHNWGVTLKNYKKNRYLKKQFNIVGWVDYYDQKTNRDYKFISSMEHKNFPIYAYQYHTEKSQFLQNYQNNIPRSEIHNEFGFNSVKFVQKEVAKNLHNTTDISMFQEYNLYYRIPQAMKNHFDYKSYTFFFNITEIIPAHN